MKQFFKVSKLMRENANLSSDNLKAKEQFKDYWNKIHEVQIIKTGKIIEDNKKEESFIFEATIKS